MFVVGRGVRLRTQIVFLQVVLVALTLGIAFGVFAYVSEQRLSDEYGQRALAIARTVAAEPEVRDGAYRYSSAPVPPGPSSERDLAAGELEHIAEDSRVRTGALYVVVTDDTGIRLTHPQPAAVGGTPP